MTGQAFQVLTQQLSNSSKQFYVHHVPSHIHYYTIYTGSYILAFTIAAFRFQSHTSCTSIMAEAHAAVAFSFHVTPEGQLGVKYNHEAIKAVWHSGLHSWRLRFIRFKVCQFCHYSWQWYSIYRIYINHCFFLFQNHLINTLYPAPPISLFLFSGIITSVQLYSKKDLSYGLIDKVSGWFPE